MCWVCCRIDFMETPEERAVDGMNDMDFVIVYLVFVVYGCDLIV